MKTTRFIMATLVCLAMLLSLTAMTAFAAEEDLYGKIDFGTMTQTTVTGDTPNYEEAAAALKAVGLAEVHNVYIDSCHTPFLSVKGYQEGYFVVKVDAGAGKVYSTAPVVTLDYRMAVCDPASSIAVQGSIDGVNYYDFRTITETTGNDPYAADCKGSTTVTLDGGQGSASVWIKIIMKNFGAPASCGLDAIALSAKVKTAESGETPDAPANVVSSVADFEALSEFSSVDNPDKGDPAATKAKLEEMGLTLPERIGWEEDPAKDANHEWVLQSCYNVFLTPKEGWKNCAYIQTLDAGEGKILESDITVTLKYWMAAGHGSYIVIETSTDGENWTEAWADEEGQGTEYDPSACTEKNITLKGTAGASKVYVKFVVNRHNGSTTGGIVKSALSASVKEGTASEQPPAKTGDIFAVVVAMGLLGAAGIVVTTKKSRK